MHQSLNLILTPKEAYDDQVLENVVKRRLNLPLEEKIHLQLRRRSIDARSKKVKINLALEVYWEETPPKQEYQTNYRQVANEDPVIIIGMGPAGMFAALQLIELGIKPIIIERGKDVRTRRRDLAAINKENIVNADSNYCFGEGGAGTYSDGKLYTRSKKRGDIRRILEILVAHGANENILIEAHPHIGTNKLPKVVAAMRESILSAGGEILFNTRVTDLLLEKDELKGVITQDGEKISGKAVILATGHSARDIFTLLHEKSILLESKDFALGVRVEHQQQLIDQIQYHCHDRGPYLPASSYALAQQVGGKAEQTRGVFSFCMCPGGFIVPAATAPGEVVVNGMSPSRRDGQFANSGMVVEVKQNDLQQFRQYGALAGMYFQQSIEQLAFTQGAGGQAAPAQRLMDFVEGRISSQLLDTSYQPGLYTASMKEMLPEFVYQSLKTAFLSFGKKMRGYLTNEAQLIGIESRTSSPVSIPRDRESGEHLQIKRLYPCGEGAGYAGGIVSAAMDGEYCARMVAVKYLGKEIG